MKNYITCEECGCVMDLDILKKKDATKGSFMAGRVFINFICQNCGEENRKQI